MMFNDSMLYGAIFIQVHNFVRRISHDQIRTVLIVLQP